MHYRYFAETACCCGNILSIHDVCIFVMIPVSEVRATEYNLALGRPTSQSNTIYVTHASPRAVDPDLTKCAFVSSKDGHAWWQVEFGAVYRIWSVEITPRTCKLKQTQSLRFLDAVYFSRICTFVLRFRNTEM